jgi:molybdopterin-containing oxidoreductase family iron-sulfur binding subunit
MKSPVLHLLQNPDVTVRGRGVMEKCTYCVQRISKARILAKRENRRIRDGEVIPACQQACPTQAIVFGDMNDPESRVHQLKQQPHNFAILGELNARPRTTYLAKIDNPNPGLSGAEASHATEH